MKNSIKYILVFLIIITSNNAFARKAPDSFADLVEDLVPAVVNISTTQTIEGAGNNPFGMFSYRFPENSPFGELPELFERFNEQNNSPSKRQATSLGSGFIISPEGYIVTNYHVIEKADEITVTFSDDTDAKATVIGRDSKTDLALLKVETNKKLPFVQWGDSDQARVGDWVIAIGNPFGLGGSVSAGIISARARDINSGPFDEFIQTDAAINRGNSGGPLFDIKGKVIGVNTAIFSPSGGNVGIGFAAPSSLAVSIIKQLKEHGHTRRGWLGVKIQTVTDEIAESIGLKKASGALIIEVSDDSPAAKAGMLPGDVILTFDEKEVGEMRKLPRIVAETDINKKVAVTVWRKEQKKTLVVTVGELDENEENGKISKPENKKDSHTSKTKEILGMHITDLNKKNKKIFGVDKSTNGVVIVKIDNNSPAAQKPIQRGDVITSINQIPVTDISKAIEIIEKAKKDKKKSVLLLINRRGETQFIAITVK